MNTKQLYTRWIRIGALFAEVHREMESELVRMREKGFQQDFIDKRDLQIQTLVEFYNDTDELLIALKHELACLKSENHFLTEILAHKISIIELMQYKPSVRLIIDKVETENLPQTLSELNG